MSDVEQIVEAVSGDPSRLDLYADECFAVFVTGEPDKQERIAKLLRALAENVTDVVTEQTQLLGKALEAEPPACNEAIHAVAIITETDPKAVSGLVSELLGALKRVDDSIAYGSAIRALATIGDETDASVNEGDELFATLFQKGDSAVQHEIIKNMGVIVVENPYDFPQMINIYCNALTVTNPEIQTFAAKTLAVIVRDDVNAVSNVDEIRSRLQDLRDNHYVDSDTIERALRMVEQASDGGSG